LQKATKSFKVIISPQLLLKAQEIIENKIVIEAK